MYCSRRRSVSAVLPFCLSFVATFLLLWTQPITAQAQDVSGLKMLQMMDRADAAARAGSTRVALDIYDQLLSQDSTDTYVSMSKANVFALDGQYQKAASVLADLPEAVKADYTVGEQAWYLILAGDLQQGRALSKKAMDMDPRRANWPLNVGHTYTLDRQPQTAKFYYRKALTRIRGQEELNEHLAGFDRFIEQGRRADAVYQMKDWYNVTYLREGYSLRYQTGWLPFLGTWITVVVGVISLFQNSGELLSPESKNQVRDWLLRTEVSGTAQRWASSFRKLFEGVFSDTHLSWTCLRRSAITTVGIMILTVGVMLGLGVVTGADLLQGDPFRSFVSRLGATVGLALLLNVGIDYLSLYQTRLVLGWMDQTTSSLAQVGWILLDAALTLFISVSVLSTLGVTLVAPSWSFSRIFSFDGIYGTCLVLFYRRGRGFRDLLE